VRGGIGMLIFGVGKCKLDGCNLTENSVERTSMIGMFSTHLYLNMTVIERNWVAHDSRQALMFAVNSVCEYTNTTIRWNHSPFAPLHQFEFRSCFGFWNCTFSENKHPELLLCDGTCEFNFTNTTISENMGSVLTTGLESIVTLNESDVRNNFSGDLPLFDIPGSLFLVVRPCRFVENVGASIVDLRGAYGQMDLFRAEFYRNRMNEFVIGGDSGSAFHITQTRFADNAADFGTVFSDNSSLIVNRSWFWRELGFALRIHGGRAVIGDNSVRNNIRPFVKAEGSDVAMTEGTFRGNIAGGVLDIWPAPRLRGLVFLQSRKEALRPDLLELCRGCSYGDSDRLLILTFLKILLWASTVCLVGVLVWILRLEAAHQTRSPWNPKEL
jgi:hypothetical protein